MPSDRVSPEEIRRAFKMLGDAVGGYDEIEMVLVGGMAGRLGGWLSAIETTKDCDVMVYDPEQAFAHVESEAFKIGQKMGLPVHWLNNASHGFVWALPKGWQKRKQLLGKFGLLTIYYVGRLDLVALKVVAGRDVDRAHLLSMKVTAEELRFAEQHVNGLEVSGTSPEAIQKARNTIAILREQP